MRTAFVLNINSKVNFCKVAEATGHNLPVSIILHELGVGSGIANIVPGMMNTEHLKIVLEGMSYQNLPTKESDHFLAAFTIRNSLW